MSLTTPLTLVAPARVPLTPPPDTLPRWPPGPHGCELLQLSRGTLDGEDIVTAFKVTGDKKVPAGSQLFSVKVGSKHKLDGRVVYPDELGVTAR